MPRDATAAGIALAVVAVLAYIVVRAWRQRSFEPWPTVIVALACFALPSGAVLIRAGISGKAEDLPSAWREHVAIAGIIAIGLGLKYLIESFGSVWPRKGDPGEKPT